MPLCCQIVTNRAKSCKHKARLIHKAAEIPTYDATVAAKSAERGTCAEDDYYAARGAAEPAERRMHRATGFPGRPGY